MKQPIDTDGKTLNEVLEALGWTKERRTNDLGHFQGYEILDAGGNPVGVFSAASLWAYLRANEIIK